mmetsp:Transcript_14022/g.12388  ORF Transcript_14022/g.12388 Transcript_14022/m.12388 type:complete len:97 (-) Transcript_14022:684-974(-)
MFKNFLQIDFQKALGIQNKKIVEFNAEKDSIFNDSVNEFWEDLENPVPEGEEIQDTGSRVRSTKIVDEYKHKLGLEVEAGDKVSKRLLKLEKDNHK